LREHALGRLVSQELGPGDSTLKSEKPVFAGFYDLFSMPFVDRKIGQYVPIAECIRSYG